MILTVSKAAYQCESNNTELIESEGGRNNHPAYRRELIQGTIAEVMQFWETEFN